MLNLGQIVYDITNDRVLFYCGIDMYKPKNDDGCYSIKAFVDEKGILLEYDSRINEAPFEFTNIVKDGKPLLGTAIAELGCNCEYFGIIDGADITINDVAVKAIQTMKEEIAVSDIRKEKYISHNKREHTKVIIVEKKRRLIKTADKGGSA